ncbi:hypothetical protein [Roseobacter sp. HKCCA0434]|uniref:hypothetical protein n=1 Tax=Roseobacter sp. HKCCA0434 TaxID=3079297 RepID=UPI002905F6E2|nr:hypothetical protein [Roseobacter sp. HKCCA0434]
MRTTWIMGGALGFVLLSGAAQACAPGEAVVATTDHATLGAEMQAGFAEVFAPELDQLSGPAEIDDAFGFATCEMGQPMLFVFAEPGPFCDGVCGVWAIAREEDAWQMILAGEGALRVAGSGSMGLPDLIAQVEGEPEVVHKYDGRSYQSALDGLVYGEIFELPEATAWQADEFGFVGIVPGAAGPEGEAVVALDAVSMMIGGADGLTTGLTDLDGDTVPEVVISGEGDRHCGADGCRHWIVKVGEAGPRLLADTVSQGALEIAASGNEDLRDVIAWGDAGARILRFDGEVYR